MLILDYVSYGVYSLFTAKTFEFCILTNHNINSFESVINMKKKKFSYTENFFIVKWGNLSCTSQRNNNSLKVFWVLFNWMQYQY